MINKTKIELFYDKECPFCNSYANYIKLKETHTLILTNAREASNHLKTLKSKGFDINEGFIIIVDDKDIYQGSDAILFLNKISKKKIFYKDNLFFRKILYALIKKIRKFILFISLKKIDL